MSRIIRGLALMAAIIGTSQSLAQDGSAVDATGRRAGGELADMAKLRDAEMLYEAAVELQPADLDAAQRGFQASAAIYQEVTDSGVDNAGLWFNQGNAYAHAGDWGRAIGAYLNAQRLDPGNQSVAANLSHARGTVSQSEPGGELSLLTRATSGWQVLSLGARRNIAVAAWCGVWGLLAVGIARKWSPRFPWKLAITGLATLSIGLGTTVGIDLYRLHASPPGVLISDQVVVRKGNGEGFTPAFNEPLGKGIEFTLIGRRPGWLHISLADGKDGWVRSANAMVAIAGNGEGEIRTPE